MGISGHTAADIAVSAEREVHARRLAPGTTLPTVRDLARQLHVSPATIAAAYKLLRARGLVVGDGRRGTRVVPAPLGATPTLVTVPAGAVDLASGNPDPALLPPLAPALRAIDAEHMLYDGVEPDRRLIAFAAGEFQAEGIPVQAVFVAGGALDAIERILREFLRPGDRVAVEDPSFPALTDLIAASGFVAMPCAVDASGPQPAAVQEALARGCRALVVTPRAQNPTGAAVSAGRAAALRQVVRRLPDVLVLENDHAAPIAGAPVHTIVGGPHGRWAVVRSTSKFLGPDLRVALVSADALTVARVRARQAVGARWPSHILQRLALALWADPSSGRRLARAADIYVLRRRSLESALQRRGIAVEARSGFNVWIPVRHEGEVVRALAQGGWAVAPGERFRIRSGPGIRVTASMLEAADAERFAEDLAGVIGRVAAPLA